MEADHQYHQASAAPPVARDNLEAAMRTITVDIDKICHDLSWCSHKSADSHSKKMQWYFTFFDTLFSMHGHNTYFGNNAPSCERLSLL